MKTSLAMTLIAVIAFYRNPSDMGLILVNIWVATTWILHAIESDK